MRALLLFRRGTEIFLRKNIPFLISFVLILLGLIPWRVAFISHFAVPFVYVSIFYWAIFRPDLMTPTVVFLLGFSADLLTVSPLGYHTLLFLAFYWAVLVNRRFLAGRPFSFLWAAFCASVLPLAVIQWLLASLLYLSWLSLGFFLIQGILLMAVYPFITALCALFYMRFLDED